jgi:hypothetical protein
MGFKRVPGRIAAVKWLVKCEANCASRLQPITCQLAGSCQKCAIGWHRLIRLLTSRHQTLMVTSKCSVADEVFRILMGRENDCKIRSAGCVLLGIGDWPAYLLFSQAFPFGGVQASSPCSSNFIDDPPDLSDLNAIVSRNSSYEA